MASVGVVTQINHPILKDALAASVVEWRRAYEKYECDLRACVTPRLLCGLVAMGVFPEHDDPSEVTSEDVQEWLANAAEVDDSDVAATVKSALSTVTMTPQPGDALGYVVTYVVT